LYTSKMRLKTLSLQNFRNLENVVINLEKDITVLIGDNAQGKTNFLESIYFLATGKAVKTETDDEVINFGQTSVNVEGDLTDAVGEESKLSTIIQSTQGSLRKRFLVNGIPRRMVDYQGNLVVVFFRPEDIELVTGSPSFRREYVDRTIGQVDREYRKVLSSYQKIITQKNKLLKSIREGFSKSDELVFWNSEQLRLGIILQAKRQIFFERINSFEKKFGDFDYKYLPNEISEKKLEEVNSREVQAAMSLVGPHRDDFEFLLKEKDLAKYGSRGEQRTAVLDLKITELSYFEKIIGARPVLLLDDIFSELDVSHRRHVLDLANLQQTIIATVEYDEYLKEALKTSQIFNVKNGEISP
jgi:DNA replication and repair protein RecF